MRLWLRFVILLLSTLLVSEARADLDPFEFQIYPYEVTGKGKLDPQRKAESQHVLTQDEMSFHLRHDFWCAERQVGSSFFDI